MPITVGTIDRHAVSTVREKKTKKKELSKEIELSSEDEDEPIFKNRPVASDQKEVQAWNKHAEKMSRVRSIFA